jgi:hypothetical protein
LTTSPGDQIQGQLQHLLAYYRARQAIYLGEVVFLF